MLLTNPDAGSTATDNVHPIGVICIVQEANVARKRKAHSPVKDGPEAKRQVPLENSCDTATKAPQVCKTAWPSQYFVSLQSASLTVHLLQNEDSWEHISEQLGWSVADCLNHKLSFKKKEDPKAKHEAMGQHIKRLRAAGWHLLHVMERFVSVSLCQA